MNRIARAAGRALVAVVAAVQVSTAGVAASVLLPTARAAAAEQEECQSLEGCYAYEDMPTFLDVAWGLVQDFARDRYAGRPFWVRLQYVPHGESGTEGCSDGSGASQYTDMSYEYCGPDRTVYVGQDLLWELYSDIGDVAAVAGVAHEFGHYLQDVERVPDPTSPAETIPHENQADCVAGAWFGYAEELGMVEEDDDRQDLVALLDFIGSSEADPGRDHGTTAERTVSLYRGIDGGLAACNAFFPDTPLLDPTEVAAWTDAMARLRSVGARIGGPSHADTGLVGEPRLEAHAEHDQGLHQAEARVDPTVPFAARTPGPGRAGVSERANARRSRTAVRRALTVPDHRVPGPSVDRRLEGPGTLAA
jgi:hypothetical protein